MLVRLRPEPPEPATPSDPRDFSEVYRRFAPSVSRWARRLGGSRVDAEDITQEVFTVVLRRINDFDPERGDLGAWIYGITVRVIQAARRRHRVRQWLARMFGPFEREPLCSEASPEAQAQSNQSRAQLYELLEQLPEAQRTAFVLYEMEELDGAAIAEITGTTVANVWVRVHRARRTLEESARRNAAKEGTS